MTASRQDFYDLLSKTEEGTVLPGDIGRIDDIVQDNTELLQVYVEYIQLVSDLHFGLTNDRVEMMLSHLFSTNDVNGEDEQRLKSTIDTQDPSLLPTTQAPPIRIHTLLSPTLPSTVGWFSLDWCVSYLIATVIVGIGALIGSWTPAFYPQQFARRSSVPSRTVVEPKTELVGRITGMVDCKWAGTALDSPDVPLGRKYELASGLMEITYDTGAKVILQGPVTYEVESKDGGYLSLGKLTARLEKKAEASNPQSPIPNPSLSTNHYPLFTIKTPTATVTDLGTEFGVDVSKAGITETCVFVGKVKLEDMRRAGTAVERILSAGQMARLEGQAAMVIRSVSGNGEKQFVREIPATESTFGRELIGQIDYSDTWTVNSSTRAGGYVPIFRMNGEALCEVLQVEQSHGNPQRKWTIKSNAAITTCGWNYDPPREYPWPGHLGRGTETGFLEMGDPGYLGFEYGVRDDFVVQFDMVQTEDRINITIGNEPAAVDAHSLSVFFRASGSHDPEIGLYTPSKGEADTRLSSGIPTSIRWYNYAVRFNLPKRQLTVWTNRQCRGTIDLATITRGMENDAGRSWADLPWTNKCITIGGMAKCQVWTDNFRVGSPRDIGVPSKAEDNTRNNHSQKMRNVAG